MPNKREASATLTFAVQILRPTSFFDKISDCDASSRMTTLWSDTGQQVRLDVWLRLKSLDEGLVSAHNRREMRAERALFASDCPISAAS